MKHLAGASLVVAAGLCLAPQVAANPIAACLPGGGGVSGQTVLVAFDADPSMGTTYDLYRGPKGMAWDPETPNVVFVGQVTAADGTATTGNTGSGVVDLLAFEITDECVPKGAWSYKTFSGGYEDYCVDTIVTVTDEDPACSALVPLAEDDGDAGCAVGARGLAPPLGIVGLGLTAVLGLWWRRRRHP